LALGVLAIVAGDRLPPGIDDVMGRVVGGTLLVLGVYVFGSLIRHGRDFRLRSRWMLVFTAGRNAYRWAARRLKESSRDGVPSLSRAGRRGGSIPEDPEPQSWHHGHHGRPGHRHHDRLEPDDTFMTYGRGTSWFVGMIHGIGAETASQILVFLAVAGAGGAFAGVLVLGAFIVGLLASNTVITIGSAYGFTQASKSFWLYATVAIVTGLFSLVVGSIFVLGKESVLPAVFGG
ncbi:MAG: hypothetical protein ABR518_08310, partial [Actinomycetota bacterium]